MSKASEAAITAIIPALRAYAMSRLRSRAHADDAVQDTLERAWRARESFREGACLKAWMFGILRNRVIDGYRNNWRVDQDVDGKMAAKLIALPDQLWRLEYADLLAAIETLTPNMRRTLLLVGLGLTGVEAAAAMDCPLGTLKSYVRRGRAKLLVKDV